MLPVTCLFGGINPDNSDGLLLLPLLIDTAMLMLDEEPYLLPTLGFLRRVVLGWALAGEVAMSPAVEALGPGVAATVGVGPSDVSPASSPPAAHVNVLTPLGLAMPARNKSLVVIVSAHVLDPGAVVHAISRGYNQLCSMVSNINDLSFA